MGEGLQARPVIQRLRATHPDLQVAYTFFSPSAERFAESIGADITSYLPFDSAADAESMFDLLQPSLLVFAKLDLWPVLVERARARDVRVAMISATVAPSSGRLGRLASLFMHDAYAMLDAVGAIDTDHARRLEQLGVNPAVINVTGDTRFDQVAQRAAATRRDSALLSALASSRHTIVAGSTWPSDESLLMPAFASLVATSDGRRSHDAPRLIIAPHEPTTAHLDAVESAAAKHMLTVSRLAAVERGTSGTSDIVLVDRTGVLGDLYALADVAYVGGGFHAAGLHSVIEPAAFGAPVVFGLGHHMSREAGLLLETGGGISVRSEEELSRTLRTLKDDVDARDTAGRAARAVVESGLGATERSVALLERLLPSLTPTASFAQGVGRPGKAHRE